MGGQLVPGLDVPLEAGAVALDLLGVDGLAGERDEHLVGDVGHVAADGEPVGHRGIGEADERDGAALVALAGEREVVAVRSWDDGLAGERQHLLTPEPGERHEREGGPAAGGGEEGGKGALPVASGLGGFELAVGLHHVVGQPGHGALEFVFGQDLVRLRLPVEAGQVEGVEGVGGHHVDAPEEAVERPDAVDPAGDRPGGQLGREPGEVPLGVLGVRRCPRAAGR